MKKENDIWLGIVGVLVLAYLFFGQFGTQSTVSLGDRALPPDPFQQDVLCFASPWFDQIQQVVSTGGCRGGFIAHRQRSYTFPNGASTWAYDIYYVTSDGRLTDFCKEASTPSCASAWQSFVNRGQTGPTPTPTPAPTAYSYATPTPSISPSTVTPTATASPTPATGFNLSGVIVDFFTNIGKWVKALFGGK